MSDSENQVESYSPTAKQAEFHKSLAKFRCFMGGFGAGKTLTGVWESIDQSMRYAGNRIAIIRDTLQDLRDTTMASFFDACPPDLIYTFRKKDNTCVMTNGSEILFRSFRAMASAPRNQFESKIKGLNLGGFYVDEANEGTKSQFLLLQGRLRLDSVPPNAHRGWLSTNPPSKDHWIYELFGAEGADRKRYHLVQASSRENPHLPPDFVANLEESYDPSWVKKFVDGEFGFMTTGEPVYNGFAEFNTAGKPWHCRKLRWQRPYGPVYRCWDFGWHRPAVVWFQVTPDQGIRVYRELMGHQEYIHEFAPRVIAESNQYFPGAEFVDVCDVAGLQKNDKSRQSTIQILEADFKIKMLYRFSIIKEGIDLIQKKLTTVVGTDPAFQIDPEGCPILVAGFMGGYAREKALDGRGMVNSEPIKDGYYEHTHDALRYGVINILGSHSSVGGAQRHNFPVGAPSWNSSQGPAAQAVPMSRNTGGNGWTER